MKKTTLINYTRHVVCLIRYQNKLEQATYKNHKTIIKLLDKCDKHLKAIIDILKSNGELNTASEVEQKRRFMNTLSRELIKTNRDISIV